MSRRTVALVASVVLAAVAAVALISYVRGLENKAFEGTETVSVFVAKEPIPAGTTGEFATQRNLIERTTIPKKVRADGAITSLDEIRGKVAAVTILKGEQIVSPRFVLPGQVRGTLPIPANRVAISLEVGIPPGVAGFVQRGDRISIIAQLSVPRRGARATGTAAAPTETRVQFLLQSVEVLEIGQRVVTTTQTGQQGQSTQQSEGRVLATLALTPGDAEKLAYAIFQGQLYFTLLPEGAKPAGTAGRTAENAFR